VERSYRHYKTSKNLLDFTDLLELACVDTSRLPRLEVLIIDEAQDLSRLQWQMVEALVQKAQRVFVAGDDDQAVFTWAGADVKSFLAFQGDIHVLQQSFRVPSTVHVLADRVVRRIRQRQDKVWAPRDYIGAVRQYNRFEDVPVSDGEWLILASTNYLLNPVHEWLKGGGILFERNHIPSLATNVLRAVIDWEKLRKGLALGLIDVQNIYKYLASDAVARGFKNFKGDPDVLEYDIKSLQQHYGLQTDTVWHESLTKISEDKREYLRAVLRRGQKISNFDRIKLSTIPGAKGGEADNVLLLMDLSPKFAKDYSTDSDSVNRLLYVAITLTKKTMHLVMPKQFDKGFRL
jgi:DNA helicase-2/ATP-dependent DNA helicase PcrA